MGKRHSVERRIIRNYTGDVSSMEIRFKIFKLMLEDRERGGLSGAGIRKQQYRDICKREQG